MLLLNLEHIKCMVTTEYVVALNVDHPMALDFLDELQKRLRQQVGCLDAILPLPSDALRSMLSPLPRLQGWALVLSCSSVKCLCTVHMQADALMMDDDIRHPSNGDDKDHASMPFELRVLEVALDVVRCLL